MVSGSRLSSLRAMAWSDGKLARTEAEKESNSLDESFIDWRLFAGRSEPRAGAP